MRSDLLYMYNKLKDLELYKGWTSLDLDRSTLAFYYLVQKEKKRRSVSTERSSDNFKQNHRWIKRANY